MKVRSVPIAAVVAAMVIAPSIAQSQGRIEGSTSKTDIERVTIRTTAASAGFSLMPLRLSAAVGGADVLIGNQMACDGGIISNSHTDVRLRDLTVRSTGGVKIGNQTAGC